ncbi:MAG: integral rane sensor signal transduction histidine kinase [Pedosphaera sp.]|nr:integral rane sensor signal transduction histidine kinase [Pedosphaera sp.]
MIPRSLKFRLVAWYAGLLLGAFVVLGGLMYGGLKLYLERDLGRAQTRRARQIADTLLAHVGQTGEAHVVDEINSWFAPETNDRFIRISRGAGSNLYISSNPADSSFDISHIPAYSENLPAGSLRKQKVPPGKELLIASVPYVTPDGKKYLVEVGASLQPVREVLHRLVILLGFTLAAGVLVATSGGYYLVGRALAPVDEIASAAERITSHNLKERLPVAKTGDELERLAVSLNHMIARLEEAWQHNRRFIADASHELRTPLTIMRGELEMVVEETGLSPEVQRTAASVLEEAERLARVVEGLMAVSRLEAGEAQQECLRFDLAELARSTAEQMCLLAEDKNIAITSDAPRAVPVDGDRARLKQVVVNLLDNAIKYTPAGGKVRLSVSGANGKAVLEVADNGIGIPAEARSHIFERFFRVDPARSREVGGAGLGLSIVKSICAAHGGQVNFQSTVGAGSCFRVELPLAHSLNGAEESKNGH